MTKGDLDLSVNIKSLHLQNPTILASGILGLNIDTLKRVANNGAGAVTIKSLTLEPRKGHNSPIIVEFEGGFMNAVGYTNPGIIKGMEIISKWDERIPLITSIVGSCINDFVKISEKIAEVETAAVEIALSCPHTPGYGLMAGQGTVEATAEITKTVRKIIKVPLIIKLSPSVSAIGDIAKAAESEGADAINMGNTVGPGMKIDINRASPILGFKIGGMSGPAIKPITIRSVYDLYRAVKIPIIATGGITYGEDVIEAMMAGATAVGIGTGIYYRGMNIFKKVCRETENWMKKHDYKDLNNLRGLAHK
jgi:dihydroorotate dehydrogenase (NAD+) catalytic subunit